MTKKNSYRPSSLKTSGLSPTGKKKKKVSQHIPKPIQPHVFNIKVSDAVLPDSESLKKLQKIIASKFPPVLNPTGPPGTPNKLPVVYGTPKMTPPKVGSKAAYFDNPGEGEVSVGDMGKLMKIVDEISNANMDATMIPPELLAKMDAAGVVTMPNNTVTAMKQLTKAFENAGVSVGELSAIMSGVGVGKSLTDTEKKIATAAPTMPAKEIASTLLAMHLVLHGNAYINTVTGEAFPSKEAAMLAHAGMATPTKKGTTPMSDKTSLSETTKLGELVMGTSAGSTYVTAILHEDFAIALRDNGGTISLRIEPRHTDFLPEMLQKQFKQLGFSGDKGNYMSQHFKAEGGALVVCGAYGAVAEQLRFLFGPDKIDSLNWKDLIGAGE